MATSTTNLGLTKPAGTDKIRIAQINGNMDILDEKIGAVGNTSLQAQVTSQNQAIAKLDSNVNITNDILADAVNCTQTMFFRGSGSSYTGALPNNDPYYGYGIFIVNVRAGDRSVIAHSSYTNSIAINYYTGNAWRGWEELALKSELTWTSLGEFASSSTSTAAPSSAKELLIVGYKTSTSAWETVSIVVPLTGSSRNCSVVGKDTTMVVYVTASGQVAIPNSSGSNITKFTVYYR